MAISKPKLATHLPEPQPLTEEQYRQIQREAAEARRVFEIAKRRLETLDAEDLRIRLR